MLPHDVLRTLFEQAACSSRETFNTLLLVSRAVNKWVQPYRLITAYCPNLARLQRLVWHEPNLDALQYTVGLHISLDRSGSEAELAISKLLVVARHAKHLAIDPGHLANLGGSVPLHNGIMQPSRLILFGSPDGLRPHTLFNQVTHLSIFSVPVSSALDPRVFPALTHFMFIYNAGGAQPLSSRAAIPSMVELGLRIARRHHLRPDFREFHTDPERYYEINPAPTPLQLVVINVRDSLVSHIPPRLALHESSLLADNVLMIPSKRLSRVMWEEEVRSEINGDLRLDRWHLLEMLLEERKRCLNILPTSNKIRLSSRLS